MRLWHKDLIPVLPRQQLLGQWRECCMIAKNISEHGTPNHLLVNKIMDYPIMEFLWYGLLIYQEMIKRNYKCDFKKFTQHFERPFGIIVDQFYAAKVHETMIFLNWHNLRYLRQCFSNLQEKFDCGGITTDDWYRIEAACFLKGVDLE